MQDMPKAPHMKPKSASTSGGMQSMPKAPSAKPKGGGGHENRKGPAKTPHSMGPRSVA